jgi:hypothetical protein
MEAASSQEQNKNIPARLDGENAPRRLNETFNRPDLSHFGENSGSAES